MGLGKDLIGSAMAAGNPYASYLNAQAGGPMWAMPGKAFNAARGAVNATGNAIGSARDMASNALNKVRSFGQGGNGNSGSPADSNGDPSAQGGGSAGGQGGSGGAAIDSKTGQQIIKTLETGFKSLEQVGQRASQLLDENSKENKELKEKLNEIAQKQDAMYKLAQEQANQMTKKQATMSHPLSKNITTMTTLLERIARATEDSAKIAKLSVGLGMNSPVKPSAVMASSGYIDPADNGSGKKKIWFSEMQQMQKDVAFLVKSIKESNEEISDKLDNVNSSIVANNQKEGGSGLFSKIKSGVLGAGKLGLLGALLAGKATWKHVVQPAADYHITRFKVGAKAKKEELESNALKEYAEALKSGDQDRIKKAKVVLKKNKISDMMANFAAENQGDVSGMEIFMKNHRNKEKAVPFDTQTRDSIIKGIPLLLSEILKAISGQDKQWNYEFGRLSTTEEAVKAQEMAAKMKHIEAADALRGNKGLIWYGKNTGKLNEAVEETRKGVGTASIEAKNMFGLNGATNSSKLVKATDKEFQEKGIHTYKQQHEVIKDLDANAMKAAKGAVKIAAKAAWNFVIAPIAKAAILEICNRLDSTESGRKFFKDFVKPNLPKLLDHCNTWVDVANSTETAFPYILNSIKSFLKDVEEGRRGIFEPVALAIRTALMGQSSNGTTISDTIVKGLEEIKVCVKGTVFESMVVSSVDFIINKAIPILLGKNQKVNEKLKNFNEKTKQLIGTSYTEMTSDEAFNKLGKGSPTELRRLFTATGYSNEDIEKMLGNIEDLKVDQKTTTAPNLMDSLRGMSSPAHSSQIVQAGNTITTIPNLEKLLDDSKQILIRLDENVIAIKDGTITTIPNLLSEIAAHLNSGNITLGAILKNSNKVEVSSKPRETLREYFSKSDFFQKLHLSVNSAVRDAVEYTLRPISNLVEVVKDSMVLSSMSGITVSTDNKPLNVIIAGNTLGGSSNAVPVIIKGGLEGLGLAKKRGAFGMAKDFLSYLAGGLLSILGNGFKAVFATASFATKLAGGILKALKPIITGAFGGLKALTATILEKIAKMIMPTLSGIGNLLKGLGIGIKKSGELLLNAIGSVARGALRLGKHMWDAVKFVGKMGGKLLGKGYNMALGLFGMLTNPIGWLKDKLVQIIGFFKNLLTGAMKTVWKGVKGAGKAIAGFFGFGEKGKGSNDSRYLRLIAAYTKGTYDNMSIYLRAKGLTPAKLKLPPASGAGSLAQTSVSAIKRVGAGAVGMATGITSFFANSINKLREKAKEKREIKNARALEKLAKNTDKIHSQFGKYWKWQKTKSIMGVIGGILQTGFSTLTSLLSGIFSGIGNLLGSLIPGAGRMLSKFGGPLIKGAINAVKSMGSLLGFGAGAGAGAGAGGGMGNMIKMLGRTGGKLLGPVGLAFMAYEAIDGAIGGWKNANKIHDLKEGQKASFNEKYSAAAGSAAGALIGGTLDMFGGKYLAQMFGFESMQEAITKGASKFTKKTSQLVTGLLGHVRSGLTGKGLAGAVVSAHTLSGLIESNPLKIERINDYKKFESLSARDLKYMLDFGFANPNDQNFAVQLLAIKEANGEDSRGYFEAAWDKAKKWVTEKFKAIWEKIKDAGSWIWEKLTSFPTLIKDALSNAWEKLKEIAPNTVEALEKVGEKFKEFFKPLADKLGNIGEFLDQKISQVITGVSDVFSTIASTVSGVTETVSGKVKNIINAAKDSIFGAFDKMLNFGRNISSVISEVIGGPVSAIYDWIKENPNIGIPVKLLLDKMGLEEYNKHGKAYARKQEELRLAAEKEAASRAQEAQNAPTPGAVPGAAPNTSPGVVTNSVDAAKMNKQANIDVSGSLTIANTPTVFNQILITLKQIESNTRVGKKGNKSSSDSNNNNGMSNGAAGNAENAGADTQPPANSSPPNPTDPANVRNLDNQIKASNEANRTRVDQQKALENANKTRDDATISPQTKKAAGT